MIRLLQVFGLLFAVMLAVVLILPGSPREAPLSANASIAETLTASVNNLRSAHQNMVQIGALLDYPPGETELTLHLAGWLLLAAIIGLVVRWLRRGPAAKA